MAVTRSERGYWSSRVAAAATAIALAVSAGITAPTAASAADVTVSTASALTTALSTASSNTITLAANISVAADVLSAATNNGVLDLAGHTLTTKNITITSGRKLTIADSVGSGALIADASAVMNRAGIGSRGATLVIDSGTVTATGGYQGAGIGGSGTSQGGGTITINGGTVHATAGPSGAGIGGGPAGAGGTVVINGGTVTAVGNGGAGIGGGSNAGGGNVTINGGVVHASVVEGIFGAGIGGGSLGAGGTVTISGGSVTAAGGWNSAGIGGGNRRNGGTILISGGTVQAVAGPLGAALGNGTLPTTTTTSITIGAGADVTAGGYPEIPGEVIGGPAYTARVSGTLRLTDGSTLTVPPAGDLDVLLGGVITEASAALANLAGNGTIANAGSITLSAARVTPAITGNNFDVTFESGTAPVETSSVTVFAPTLTVGARIAPTPTIGSIPLVFWNTAPDGTGSTFTEGTLLTGDVTVYAQRAPVSLAITSAETMTAGDTLQLAVEGAGSGITADLTGSVAFTSDRASDVISGSTLTVAEAGERAIMVTANADPTIRTSGTLTVSPAAPAALSLTPSATTVDQGDTITITATAEDAYGNTLGDVTDDITLASDVTSDLIDGNTVTFPTASLHTITATLGAATAVVVIDVIPTPTVAPTSPPPSSAGDASTLIRTGVEHHTSLLAAMTLTATGMLLMLLRRRRPLAR